MGGILQKHTEGLIHHKLLHNIRQSGLSVTSFYPNSILSSCLLYIKNITESLKALCRQMQPLTKNKNNWTHKLNTCHWQKWNASNSTVVFLHLTAGRDFERHRLQEDGGGLYGLKPRRLHKMTHLTVTGCESCQLIFSPTIITERKS